MMQRWRCFSASMIVMALMAVPFAMSAAALQVANGLPPDGHVVRIILTVSALIVAIFGFAKGMNWLFVKPSLDAWKATQEAIIEKQNAAMRVFMSEAIMEITHGFDGLMERHILASDPHPDASKRMHGALERADGEILKELAETKRILRKLVRAHNTAMQEEHPVGCVLTPRDPADSPYPTRSTDDPGPNHTAERGKHKAESLLVEDEENE